MTSRDLDTAPAIVKPVWGTGPGTGTGLGILLMVEALLSFAPVAILGAAIGWPAFLGKPAAELCLPSRRSPALWCWGMRCTCCIPSWWRP